MNGGGSQYWTTDRATGQLQVSRKVINQWVARSKRVGHEAGRPPVDCPRCQEDPAGFPHIDPPVRARGVAGYVAQQLLDAEAYTAGSPRGGARRAS